MFNSGNIDVRNLAHLFESRCIFACVELTSHFDVYIIYRIVISGCSFFLYRSVDYASNMLQFCRVTGHVVGSRRV